MALYASAYQEKEDENYYSGENKYRFFCYINPSPIHFIPGTLKQVPGEILRLMVLFYPLDHEQCDIIELGHIL